MRGSINMSPAMVSSQDRIEYVYALPLEAADAFAEGVAKHIEIDPHYDIEDDERSKRYVTTLYFDTDTHQIAEACANGSSNIKLRAREYYAPAGISGVYREPDLWLEIKRREGARTFKQRCNILARELGDLLESGSLTREDLVARLNRWGEHGDRVIGEILELIDRAHKPLRPDCIAHYRRRAWQDDDEGLRVTLDTELAFYRPPNKLMLGYGSSLVEVIAKSEPLFEFEHAIVEAKIHGPMPAWLNELLEPTKAFQHRTFSKFLVASRIVAG